MMPPALLQLKIHNGYGRGLGLWLPLFVLWPVGLACFVLLLPVLVIGELVVAIAGLSFRPLLAVFALCGVMSAARGLTIDVGSNRDRRSVRIVIQ